MRFDEPHFIALQINPANLSIELFVVTKFAAILSQQRIDEPESCVVQGSFVLVVRVSQPGNHCDYSRHSSGMVRNM